MVKRALITGVTGQDGSYLAELLLDQGYEVSGMVRRSSTINFERIAHIQDRINLVAGDLLDEVSMINILKEIRPQEVYNLAAQSFVQQELGQVGAVLPGYSGDQCSLRHAVGTPRRSGVCGVCRAADVRRVRWCQPVPPSADVTCQDGGRFSAKAVIPSLASAVWLVTVSIAWR